MRLCINQIKIKTHNETNYGKTTQIKTTLNQCKTRENNAKEVKTTQNNANQVKTTQCKTKPNKLKQYWRNIAQSG